MAKQALIFLIADRAMRRSPAFETARRLAERTGSALHIFLPAWSRPIALAGLLLRAAPAPFCSSITRKASRFRLFGRRYSE